MTVCWIVGFALGPVIEAVIIFGLLLPSIAVCARRLHDIGKSGWLQLIQLIPIIGVIILIIWCATEGTKKKNEYSNLKKTFLGNKNPKKIKNKKQFLQKFSFFSTKKSQKRKLKKTL